MKEIQITLHIEAETAKELSMLTVQAQVQWRMTLQFFDFTQVKSGKFICWYQVPHTIWVEKVVNGKA